MKHSIIFLIIGIIALGSNIFGWFKHDYSCIVFPHQCEENDKDGSPPVLGQLIPGAAVDFLGSTRDFEEFLKEVEKSELYDANFPVLQACIDKAIVGMENARCKYEDILNISRDLEPDVVILEMLIQFDYDGLQSNYHLNPPIFEKAATFCQAGDIRGIYISTFDTINAVLERLGQIKAMLEKDSLPELYIMWETGQLYFESKMFGQYVSRIFYEIYKGVNRN
jgi:hypothetical protein